MNQHASILARRTVGTWVAIVAGAILAASLVAIVLSALAVGRLDDARTRLVDRVGPARVSALVLFNAYIDQETGLRGYALSGADRFLDPDRTGRRAERAARRTMDAQFRVPELRDQRDEYAAVLAAAARWRREFADPAIAAIRASGPQAVKDADIARGTALFDVVRARMATLRGTLEAERRDARQNLSDAASQLKLLLAIAAALILLTAAAAILVLRRVVTVPLGRLSTAVRSVVDGDFDAPLQVDGPREIASLAVDTDAMRARILAELAALRRAEEVLREQSEELQRSNAELEQFAYVASHDLQEPLRKIVSFNQMLQKRYAGQLDDRADQYIGFAVDGARRMQILINDLLAFSRVGRVGGDWADVPADELLDAALDNLAVAVEESDAVIERDPLPEVQGDRALLTLVFQNLVGNAIKFRGDEPPHIRVTVTSRDDEYEFAVSDDGIGIDAEYGERIFIIFQRLHARSSYEGTGIGLAMCRKIIDHHGGRIWLDDTTTRGTTFRFTLPRKETA